ncbi:MAG: phosphoribosyltransferase family protein, partial [Bdellovibrionales bacterium]|nr:phosphoribosyltransferase family protein [Bdellovibrionales bacterium]
VLEIHKDALPKYSKVLLVDDLLATGGTALGAIELLEKIDCKVLETCFIVDLPELGGGKKLHDNGHEFFKLVDFDGH